MKKHARGCNPEQKKPYTAPPFTLIIVPMDTKTHKRRDSL
jgi:hypothetical protein